MPSIGKYDQSFDEFKNLWNTIFGQGVDTGAEEFICFDPADIFSDVRFHLITDKDADMTADQFFPFKAIVGTHCFVDIKDKSIEVFEDDTNRTSIEKCLIAFLDGLQFLLGFSSFGDIMGKGKNSLLVVVGCFEQVNLFRKDAAIGFLSPKLKGAGFTPESSVDVIDEPAKVIFTGRAENGGRFANKE